MALEDSHTVGYKSFIKSQIAVRHLTLRILGASWSRDTLESRPNKTLEAHRVATVVASSSQKAGGGFRHCTESLGVGYSN